MLLKTSNMVKTFHYLFLCVDCHFFVIVIVFTFLFFKSLFFLLFVLSVPLLGEG